MRLLLMMMLLFPIQVFSGPYQDAQQYGQAGTNAIAGSISNGSVTNQSVPGFQTSTPPEAQLNNQAALNNAALLGTAQDTSGAGQFIYNSNANNAQFTFSPNDPLITGSNQIQADAYTTMSALNPSNSGATTCVDIVTNTTGIVDTYTCNQSRPGAQVLCSRDLSVSVSSNSSCVLGSLLTSKTIGRFTVSPKCGTTGLIQVETTLSNYPNASVVKAKDFTAASSGKVLVGYDKSKSLFSNIMKSGCSPPRFRIPGQGWPCYEIKNTPIYFSYTHSCSGSACTLRSGGISVIYTKQHTVYSYTDTWTNQCQ